MPVTVSSLPDPPSLRVHFVKTGDRMHSESTKVAFSHVDDRKTLFPPVVGVFHALKES